MTHLAIRKFPRKKLEMSIEDLFGKLRLKQNIFEKKKKKFIKKKDNILQKKRIET